FQAADGIRDFHVTGVQTCALPILATPPPRPKAAVKPDVRKLARTSSKAAAGETAAGSSASASPPMDQANRFEEYCPALRYCQRRSEERRVGKGRRCGRWAHQQRR